jgi:beta-mannosidase
MTGLEIRDRSKLNRDAWSLRILQPYWLLFLLLWFMTASGTPSLSLPNTTTRSTQLLNTGWKFRQAGKSEWHPATVPGCVHTDLLNNKLIDDPFYRDNEQKLQWIGKVDWEYESVFQVKPETLKAKHVELVFAGLDTYAQVFLNDSPLLSVNNMFREWRVDAKALLRLGENHLRIYFRSPINEILPVMAKLDYQLPSPNDQGEKTSPYTRKAPYQFGWDWGPRFVTSGIWKPVALETWDDARIESIRMVTKELKNDAAELSAELEISAGNSFEAIVLLENQSTRGVMGRQTISLKPGLNRTIVNFSIKKPRVWWPNGMGLQPLYSFQARLLNQQELIDQKATQMGIRTLELRQQPDQWGKSFEFVINGVPVFAKGGNWIPADSFPTRITRERYRELIKSVRDTNMNMLRVWGGGIYESDDFYDLCDEMGILVWQDFMFACSMYPGSQEFLDNVRQEAIDNIKRLRNHPSLVIWVGNNEVETAWMHWGWKQNLPAKLWDYYKAIFHDVLPKVCAELDPSRPYWPSSPSSNLEDDSDSQKVGDVHYWGVWHAALPFTDYEKQLPRFMSEYGFQSFPEIKTVASYALPEDRTIESPVMMAHQKHPRGNQLIREYMLRDYPQPKDFESFLYVSQLLQAEGIKVGAEHLRRIMPRNMGSLYWQINDCWPVASWSSIDYFGRWKALQYYARRFYSELLISPHDESGELKIYVVSDKQKAIAANLRLTLMDLSGNPLLQKNKDVTIEGLRSAVYLSENKVELLGNRDPHKTFLTCELIINGKVVSTSRYFFAPAKDLALTQPNITTAVSPSANGFLVSLTTDVFARAVYLTLDEDDGFFSDNYFDLVPGQAVKVELKTRKPVKKSEVEAHLKIRSLVDAF